LPENLLNRYVWTHHVGRVPGWSMGIETNTGAGIKERTRLVWPEAISASYKYLPSRDLRWYQPAWWGREVVLAFFSRLYQSQHQEYTYLIPAKNQPGTEVLRNPIPLSHWYEILEKHPILESAGMFKSGYPPNTGSNLYIVESIQISKTICHDEPIKIALPLKV
jgi:hypothetical protein